MVRAMVVQPGKLAEVKFISLEDMARLIGTDFEVVNPFGDEVAVLVNSQGKILGLPLNRSWRDDGGNIIDIFAGPMVIIDEKKGDLSDEQVQTLLDYFGEIETPDDWEEDDGEPIENIIELLEKIFS